MDVNRSGGFALHFLAAFERGEAAFVDLGDTGQCADVFAILLDGAGEGLYLMVQEFEGLRECLVSVGETFKAFVYGHERLSPRCRRACGGRSAPGFSLAESLRIRMAHRPEAKQITSDNEYYVYFRSDNILA
jgi:hypothetical protein